MNSALYLSLGRLPPAPYPLPYGLSYLLPLASHAITVIAPPFHASTPLPPLLSTT